MIAYSEPSEKTIFVNENLIICEHDFYCSVLHELCHIWGIEEDEKAEYYARKVLKENKYFLIDDLKVKIKV